MYSLGLASSELGAALVVLYLPSWATPIAMRTIHSLYLRTKEILLSPGTQNRAVALTSASAWSRSRFH